MPVGFKGGCGVYLAVKKYVQKRIGLEYKNTKCNGILLVFVFVLILTPFESCASPNVSWSGANGRWLFQALLCSDNVPFRQELIRGDHLTRPYHVAGKAAHHNTLEDVGRPLLRYPHIRVALPFANLSTCCPLVPEYSHIEHKGSVPTWIFAGTFGL